jgi:CheY-like chemotaxis protein
MPIMDSFEATRRIRLRELERDLPCTLIIVLSASSELEEQEHGAAAG